MANVQGASFPLPYGGRPRQIMVDLDPQRALRAGPLGRRRRQRHQRAEPHPALRHRQDRHAANTTSGSTARPDVVDAFNNLPIKQTNGTTVYVRDVAHVRDGYAVQTNIVRHNGARARAAHGAEERRLFHARYRARS